MWSRREVVQFHPRWFDSTRTLEDLGLGFNVDRGGSCPPNLFCLDLDRNKPICSRLKWDGKPEKMLTMATTEQFNNKVLWVIATLYETRQHMQMLSNWIYEAEQVLAGAVMNEDETVTQDLCEKLEEVEKLSTEADDHLYGVRKVLKALQPIPYEIQNKQYELLTTQS